jgi:ABC-type Fe3+ transport system permease subunit
VSHAGSTSLLIATVAAPATGVLGLCLMLLARDEVDRIGWRSRQALALLLGVGLPLAGLAAGTVLLARGTRGWRRLLAIGGIVTALATLGFVVIAALSAVGPTILG